MRRQLRYRQANHRVVKSRFCGSTVHSVWDHSGELFRIGEEAHNERGGEKEENGGCTAGEVGEA